MDDSVAQTGVLINGELSEENGERECMGDRGSTKEMSEDTGRSNTGN